MTIEKAMESFNIIVETVWLPLATTLNDRFLRHNELSI